MSHFPNTFWGGVLVTFILHLAAMWLYHRAPSLLLLPIAAAWRSSSERARAKRDQQVALLRSNREELHLATLNEVLFTVRFFFLASSGAMLLLLLGVMDFLGRHFPSELAQPYKPRGLEIAGVLAGLFLFALAFFDLNRFTDTHALIRAATKPPAEPAR
jgi:hypothetical protein